jgi:hypothetical protein
VPGEAGGPACVRSLAPPIKWVGDNLRRPYRSAQLGVAFGTYFCEHCANPEESRETHRLPTISHRGKWILSLMRGGHVLCVSFVCTLVPISNPMLKN